MQFCIAAHGETRVWLRYLVESAIFISTSACMTAASARPGKKNTGPPPRVHFSYLNPTFAVTPKMELSRWELSGGCTVFATGKGKKTQRRDAVRTTGIIRGANNICTENKTIVFGIVAAFEFPIAAVYLMTIWINRPEWHDLPQITWNYSRGINHRLDRPRVSRMLHTWATFERAERAHERAFDCEKSPPLRFRVSLRSNERTCTCVLYLGVLSVFPTKLHRDSRINCARRHRKEFLIAP